MNTYVPFAVKTLVAYEQAKKGEKLEIFETKTKSSDLHAMEELKTLKEIEDKGENPLPGKKLTI